MEEFIERIIDSGKSEGKEAPGLFLGNIGECLSLYLINKITNNNKIEALADDLLDKTIKSIETLNDTSFDCGLAGIGWAINLLHMNKCIEGNIDDILFDIDAAIYKSLCAPENRYGADLIKGLVGVLVYVIYRLKNKDHKKEGIQNQLNETALRLTIDKLELKIYSRIQLVSKDIFTTVLWEFPILFYCLGEAMEMGIYKGKIESMIANWSYTLVGLFPYLNINRLAMANSLAFANSKIKNNIINSYIDTLFYSINFVDYIREIDKESITLKGDWFYAMFNIYVAQKLMKKKHVRYPELKKMAKHLPNMYFQNTTEMLNNMSIKHPDMSFIKGYSGALLVYLFFQSVSKGKSLGIAI